MLFKHIDPKKLPTGTNPKDALKRYVSSFQVSMSWATLEPIVEAAELNYIVPAIGQAQYDEIESAYEGYPTAALDANTEALIRKLQRTVAYFTWYLATKELLTATSDMGTKETTDKESTALIPRQWTIKSTLQHAASQGYYYLELGLAFLEANATLYPLWTESETYSIAHDLFFNNGKELSDHIPSKVGRVVYLQLKPAIRKAEKKYILPVIGQAFFDELKLAIKNRTLTTDQTNCISEIREALAEWVLQYAIPYLRLDFNNGLLEPSLDTDGMFQRHKPEDETVRSMWVNLNDAGRFFLTRLRTWLQQNADTFPTYKDSDAYEDCTPFSGFITTDYENDDRSVIGFG